MGFLLSLHLVDKYFRHFVDVQSVLLLARMGRSPRMHFSINSHSDRAQQGVLQGWGGGLGDPPLGTPPKNSPARASAGVGVGGADY